ncbi:hypothetical protein VT84_03485 [Gemmata sp. SH-PL17]|uniref:hypothetical protein n=1 Tax=Gemmata sp. SH-PL17 TaxID=1630693 RepID=UPI00078C1A9A|nr:hypothetical protein [Gemmata sp. SH-PL17]AMV23446.1 hypothetical protein VT84_03485 [Gemmata sp. SH-PL17]
MPSRLLREGILDSAAVNSLSLPAEVFYRRLMSVVDDFGRFDGRPAVLRGRLYALKLDTVREADITRWIAECEKVGLISLYTVDSKPYILFEKLGTPRAKESKFPGPGQADKGAKAAPQITSVNACEQMKTDVPDSYSGTDSYSGADSFSCSELDKPTREPDEPPVMTFPCAGSGPREWCLTQSKLTEWSNAFPGVDVLAECRKARQWLIDNPRKCKTHSGMARFLGSWLGRAQDSGRAATSRQPNLFSLDHGGRRESRVLAQVAEALSQPPE